MSELKPCPFCGAISHLDRDSSGWNKIKANHSDNCPLAGNNLLTWSSGEIVPIVKKWNTRTIDNTITEQEKVISRLLECLCAIQDNCIGEIAMNYRLDAEQIGLDITKATGMTNPELHAHLAKHKQSKGE